MASDNPEISTESISAANAEQLSAITASLIEAFNTADAAGDQESMDNTVGLMAAAAERRSELSTADEAADTKGDEPKAEAKAEDTDDKADAEDKDADTSDDSAEAKADDSDESDAKAEDEAKAEPEANDEAPAEVEAATIEEDTPMAASVESQGATEGVEVPEDRVPVLAASPRAIVAGADIPQISAGTSFHTAEDVNRAFLSKLGAVRKAPGGSGERHVVASVNVDYPPERMLDGHDAVTTTRLIEAVTSPEAITAAGGCCAPLEVRYDIFGMGSTARPLRDSLPAFGSARLGIRYVTPPRLGELAGAVGLWSCSTDAAASANPLTITTGARATNVATITTSADHGLSVGDTVIVDSANDTFDGTVVVTSVPSDTTFTYANVGADEASGAETGTVTITKACVTVQCAEEVTAEVKAIPLCLKFGNMMSRAFPELVARNNDLALIEHARFAERNLLNLIDASSTQTTHAQVFGTARDFLLGIGRAASEYRRRHRLDRNQVIRVVAPEFVLDAMRDDLTAQLPGDNTLSLADSTISSYLTARRVAITWHMDAAVTAQGAGDLNCYPATFEAYLFAEGSFVFLDGGTLDLGIIRDSGLVSTNDYLTFVETFEGLAFVGVESIAIAFTTNVEGATMGTLNPATTDYCALAGA
jgi:hypothetical protein